MSLTATTVERDPVRSPWRVPVDAVRKLILRGSESLPRQQRPIYNGFVIGDDRGSDPTIAQSFEDSGLAHLLVVSGENLVFVIAVATPLVSRLPRRSRIVLMIAILLLFAAVTRFEPSILRATVMALIAIISVGNGRPIDARQRLAAAASLLILIDPLLVESFGFRLSIAATAGIICLSKPIMKLLRGPAWFRQVFAVTVAAQIAVAPLIIPTFGPMPLASLPANVLAEPIAGFVMMWGSSVGLLAGLVGNGPATILLLPVRAGLWWILNVASWCAALSLPRLNLVAITGLFGFGFLLFQWRYGGRTRSLEHRQRPPAG
ncbi:MAG: ComEC/Rec2 family competence protein [Actinobacteria bacterium]|nr:ComEC/Rec2 family competence protein [Actinomycetota bacterium]